MDTDEEIKVRLLAYAGEIGGSDSSAEDTARERGWIGAAGEVTEEGRAALPELEEQTTRGRAFR